MAIAETKRLSHRPVRLISLFLVFFKIGVCTWGGGYAMLPLIENELVTKRKWLDAVNFVDGIAVAESVPGAMAINTATFVGSKIAGETGAVVAALGAAMPSYIALILVAMFLTQMRQSRIVLDFFKGATPAIVALLANSVVDMGRKTLQSYKEVVVAFGLLDLLILHLHPIIAIAIGGTLGILWGEQK
ncbi:MAG: chromate transporter [Chloroflexota bacterium]